MERRCNFQDVKSKTQDVLCFGYRVAQKRRYIAFCLVFCAVSLIFPTYSHTATLEPKTGARPLGMSAFSAVADDINAICWNPAGLSLLQNQELTAVYAPLYGFDTDINQSYLAYAYPAGKWGTIGINLTYLSYGDMDWRDDGGKRLGTFTRKDYSVYASYGLNLMEGLSIGASMGTTSIKIDSIDESATGIGFDFGALYTIASRASIGLYLENIGGISASDREIARQKLRAGTAFAVVNKPNTGLTMAIDVDGQQGKVDTLYSGFEWSVFSPSSFFIKRKIQERQTTLKRYEGIADYSEGLPERQGKTSLYIRGGVRKRLAVSEPIGFSGGFCVKYAIIPKSMNMRIEHAFEVHPYLETTHKFSLGLEFGKMVYD